MNYGKQVLAVLLFFVPLVASAQLGSSNGVQAAVPFQFMVGDKVVPAGECIVQEATMAAETIVVRSKYSKVSLFTAAAPIEVVQEGRGSALVFHKYGDRYFLAQVRVEGSHTIYQLPESKAEAELRGQNVPATEETVPSTM